ncbi:MAG TPA: phosphoribosylamine--glycine ligase [Longimicrobiaceae bacterium]|nr:phosphoribosylamine--glycine ligase [Longimicrobiaceae bacterium]
MKILIVGNGGREHALLWKLRRDAPGADLFVTRANGGMGGLATSLDIAPGDIGGLADWAAWNGAGLTVVGPEIPLDEGIVDAFVARGLPIFGPTQAAARIESSKAFSKRLMRDYGIPTAAFRRYSSTDIATFDADEAKLRGMGELRVVKASGLAAGKGVLVCETVDEAIDAAREMLAGDSFGAAGREVVIEEFMHGEELSVFALTDGTNVVPMLPAQDHKRIGEGETGPNTGGMGAYAPVALATPELMRQVTEEILRPTVAALAAEGHPFRGLLYAGLMLTETGPRVVEFNCRFGDPETQVVLPLLASSLLDPLLAIARGESIAGASLEWRSDAAVTTVLASGGYPGDYHSGIPIHVDPAIESMDDVLVFHAGTKTSADGTLVTSGGRVMAVTALAPTVGEAAERSRAAADMVGFDGRYFRRDIAHREVARTEVARA